jgi:molybdopterin converting factor small subunit
MELYGPIASLPQHLILVESREFQLYFETIFRQLYDDDTGNEIFTKSSLHFVPVEKEKQQQDADDLDAILDKLHQDLLQTIQKALEKEFDDGCQNLKDLLLRRKLLTSQAEKFIQKMSQLKRIPVDFLDSINKSRLHAWPAGVVEDLRNHYASRYHYFTPKTPAEVIVSFVERANFYVDKKIHRTLGIVSKPFTTNLIVYTHRYGAANFILDPLHLLFFMQKEKVQSRVVEELTANIRNAKKADADLNERLDKIGMNESNWNSFLFCADKVLLENFLNLLLAQMQKALIMARDDYYYDDDDTLVCEKRRVEFIRPKIELIYDQYILSTPVETEDIHALFCDNPSSADNNNCCVFKKYFYNDTSDFCLEKFFNYLRDGGYNFLIPFDLVKDLKQLII